MKSKFFLLPLLLVLFIGSVVSAQNTEAITASDYERAAAMLSKNLSKYVDNTIYPRWTSDGNVWYKSIVEEQIEYKLYNPKKDQKLSAASKKALFEKASVKTETTKGSRVSPDGKYTAFIKDWNLWIKEVATNKETQLTTDGLKDFGYATDNAGWKHSNKAILSWSPDSKNIATFQQDQRHVNSMYLVKTTVGAGAIHWRRKVVKE